MNKHVVCLASALLACAAPVAQAKPSRFIAAYSQSDTTFTETIRLGSDGKYTQTEKQTGNLYQPKRTGPLLRRPLPNLFPNGYKCSGRWVLRDKPGGALVPIPADGVLPKGATVELSKAMPFGLTWENRSPQYLRMDRAVEADSFQPVPPDK